MKPEFVIDIQEESIDFPQEGLFVLLIFQHEVFPHLAILNESKYWSLSLNKVHRAAPGKPKWNSFLRKNIPVVLVKIKASPDDEKGLLDAFANTLPLRMNEQTCLSPVLQFFRIKSSADIQAQVVTELLAQLSDLSLLERCVALNLKSGPFSLPRYTRMDVLKSIRG